MRHRRLAGLALAATAAAAMLALTAPALASTGHHPPKKSIVGGVQLIAAHPGNHEIAPHLTGKALDQAVMGALFGRHHHGKLTGPPPPTSPNCLASASTYCWWGRGSGNQVEITNEVGNYMAVAVVNCHNGDSFTWCEFQSGSGHCTYLGGSTPGLFEGSNLCTDHTGNGILSSSQYDLLDPVASGYHLVPALDTSGCPQNQCTWSGNYATTSASTSAQVQDISVGFPAWVTWTR